MPIASTAIYAESPQADGRRYVRETHVDGRGEQYVYTYLANSETDVDAIAAERAARLAAELPAMEVQRCIAFAKSGQNPLYFQWTEQPQLAGLRTMMRYFLDAGLTEAMTVAPVVAQFSPELFANICGITVETAGLIIDWAKADGQVEAAKSDAAARAAAEIGAMA